MRHVQHKHKKLYESKQAVDLLKEDEEPMDPAMTNWADYAFNYPLIDPDFKLELNLVGNSSFSRSPKKEKKRFDQAAEAQIVEQSSQIVQEV